MNAWVDVLAWTALGVAVGATLARSTLRLIKPLPHPLRARVAAAAVTGGLFGLSIQHETTLLRVLVLSLFAAVAVQLAAIDIAEHRLPTALIWPTFGALVVVLTTSAVTAATLENLGRAAAGSLALVAFYLVIAIASRGGLGAGDVRLAAPVGWLLAWQSWSALLSGTIIALVGASILGATLIRRPAGRQNHVPYGPAMLSGAMTMLIFGAG